MSTRNKKKQPWEN
jgi:hypothetical protein